MAQRVNVELVDDIDETDAAETVSFGLDGVSYEIDLSAENADKLRESLSLYVGHARKSSRSRRSSGSSSRSSSRRSSGGASAADMRAWARENGFKMPERGRVSSEVRAAYEAAH